MSKLTKLCKGQPCFIRLPGICGDPETVVPAHLRLSGISGLGLKAPDIFACPACMNCHDAVDRRRYLDMDRDYVQAAHKDAIFQWQKVLWDRGFICEGVGV